MKTGWRTKPRKERLEELGSRAEDLSEHQSAEAWRALMIFMVTLSHPELPPVKFNDLLLAIARAHVRGKAK